MTMTSTMTSTRAWVVILEIVTSEPATNPFSALGSGDTNYVGIEIPSNLEFLTTTQSTNSDPVLFVQADITSALTYG